MHHDALPQQALPLSTQVVLDRLAEFQKAIESKLDEVARHLSSHSSPAITSTTQSPFLRSFAENWQLIVFVAVLTAVETASIVYLVTK